MLWSPGELKSEYRQLAICELPQASGLKRGLASLWKWGFLELANGLFSKWRARLEPASTARLKEAFSLWRLKLKWLKNGKDQLQMSLVGGRPSYSNNRVNGESTRFQNRDKVNRCEMTRAYLHESVEFILHKKQSWSHRSWSVDQNSHLQEENRRTTQCSYVTIIISNHTRQCPKCWLVLGKSLHVQPRCNEVWREWKVLFGLARVN